MTDDDVMPSMPVLGLRPAATPGQAADLIVRNARIYTGDPDRLAAPPVAIKDVPSSIAGRGGCQ